LRAPYDACMKSRPHRDKVLGRGLQRVGIGVCAHDGFLWVTLLFVG
jgi:hypothetical protein